MQLWQRLYNMVWLSAATLMVFPRWFGKYSAPVHVLLGLALLVLARIHAKRLAALPVPERVKRISQAVVATTTQRHSASRIAGSRKLAEDRAASAIGGAASATTSRHSAHWLR